MSIETQNKIIQASIRQFAEKGYVATSIRDIAQEAKVNIAAINYHFKSKEALLFQVISHGYQTLRNEIDQLDLDKIKDLSEFMVCVFRILLKHHDMIVNCMRIMMSPACAKIKGLRTKRKHLRSSRGRENDGVCSRSFKPKIKKSRRNLAGAKFVWHGFSSGHDVVLAFCRSRQDRAPDKHKNH